MPKSQDSTTAYIPPSNFEAEEAVLGAVLIDNDALHEVAHFLRPEHFYREQNKWLYEAYLYLSKTKTPIDIVTLAEELSNRGRLEEMGGEATIIGLVNTVPTSIHIFHYAKIVESLATRRQLLGAASTIANLAGDTDLELETVLSDSESILFDISHQRSTTQIKSMKDVAAEHLENIEHMNEHGTVQGVSTGFMDLDKGLSAGGFEKGQLVMIAADTGMGKSALLLDIITNAAKDGHKSALFTLEMTEQQMFQRKVAAESKVPVSQLKNPQNMKQDEWVKYYDALGRLSELPVHIDESAFITPMQLLSKCRRLQATTGLDIVAVDYLALMGADGVHNNETLRLGSISRALKLIAKELHVILVVCAQLNAKQIGQRQDKRPQLTDLRFSSDPNNDSDVVLFIYRDEYYNPDTSERPNIGEVTCAKQREGFLFTADLFWQAAFATFKSLQRQEIDFNSPPEKKEKSTGPSMVPMRDKVPE